MALSVRPFHVPWTPPRALARRAVGVTLLVTAIALVLLLGDQNFVVAAAVSAPAGGLGLVLVGARGRTRPVAPHVSLVGDWDAFRREIDRSRRYERPLALATASLPAAIADSESVVDLMARAKTRLRSVDILWHHGSRLWILMPESTRDGGIAAIKRITEVSPSALDARWRLVMFPDDALTTGALIAQLRRSAPLDHASLSTSSRA